MKKFFSLLFATSVILCLASCNKHNMDTASKLVGIWGVEKSEGQIVVDYLKEMYYEFTQNQLHFHDIESSDSDRVDSTNKYYVENGRIYLDTPLAFVQVSAWEIVKLIDTELVIREAGLFCRYCKKRK